MEWMQGHAWLVVMAGPILVGIFQLVRRKYGSPWAWEAIQRTIDGFRSEIFDSQDDDPLDHHRVTLFKKYNWHVWCTRPKKDMLVAVARSNHMTKKNIQRFLAPDDGEACEGVVGMAWRCGSWVLVPSVGSQLPVLEQGANTQDIEEYARETGVRADWVSRQLERSRPLALSYAALLVRVRGQPWGVLVLDSRQHETLTPNRLERFKAYGSLLTPLLERA